MKVGAPRACQPLRGVTVPTCGQGSPQAPPASRAPPPEGVSYPPKSRAPPTEHRVHCRGCLQADCSCISGGLRPPNTPCFPGRTPSSPGPSGRGTTRFAPYVPLDPLCGPGADKQRIERFEARRLIPGRLSGPGFDGLGGRQIDGLVPDSSLCSLTLTLRTTRSRLTEHVGGRGNRHPHSPPPPRGRCPEGAEGAPHRGRCPEGA